MFQEGKVYVDRFDRLYFYEHGHLHTSTGFKYKKGTEEDYTLTKMSKDQMYNLLEEKKKARYKHRY